MPAGDWSALRALVNKDLIARLAGMDPQAAWAEWQALCAGLRCDWVRPERTGTTWPRSALGSVARGRLGGSWKEERKLRLPRAEEVEPLGWATGHEPLRTRVEVGLNQLRE